MILLFLDGKLVDPMKYRVRVEEPIDRPRRIVVRFEPGALEQRGAFYARRVQVIHLLGARWVGAEGDSEGELRLENSEGQKLK